MILAEHQALALAAPERWVCAPDRDQLLLIRPQRFVARDAGARQQAAV
ncbi:MAG: hypothetical protein HGA45_43120, partial [Chloroflexales bacterium]|nr:hypothetical protein [Chloroflexales bacterium]